MSNNDNPKKREKPELVWEIDEFRNFKTTEESIRKAIQYYEEHTIEYLKSELDKMSELLKNENLPQEERERLLRRQKIFKKQLKNHTE